MEKAILFTALLGPFAIIVTVYALNSTERHCTRAHDFTFAGDLVLVETCRGSLGLALEEGEIVHRY